MASPISDYLHVAGLAGKHYLATNGPTSRLEEKVSQGGELLGYQTDVYVTPTAMFISMRDQGKIYTSLETIHDNVINFSDMLFYDKIVNGLSNKSMSLDEARHKLENFKTSKFSFPLVTSAAFLIGFLSSYPKYGHLIGGLGSGLIAALVYIVGRPLGHRLKFSGVFTDFVGCFLAFVLSIIAGSIFGVPIPAFVIGSVILIVPGLTLTSAISELAEHHFVSGTVKMMKALLILVAMGVSYLLVENLLTSMGYTSDIVMKRIIVSNFFKEPWFQIISRFIMIASFCVFFHVPLKAFPGAIFCGMASVLVLDLFKDPKMFVLASFTAAMTVGVISLVLARIYSWPSQVFSTTGILSLVPGLLALSAFYSFSETTAQGVVAYRVALAAGAITFGLFTARMPFRFYNSIKNLPVTN